MTNTRTQELAVKGFTQSDICQILQLSKYTVSRDIKFLREQAKEAIKNQIDEKLPYEFDKAVKGIEEIIKEAFIMVAQAEKTQDNKGKVTALSLAKDSIQTKMDLLTNAMLNDSIKFVEDTKQKLEDSFTSEEELNTLTTKF
ncbi:MAG: hypothetical protein MRJ93_14200 [Nitrososphaeraceae archaeon]|nr:hypothetical protein [Nitrososphaeraceae archaeon]